MATVRRLSLIFSGFWAAAIATVVVPASAQEAENPAANRAAQLYATIQWEQGPNTAKIGDRAQIKLPPGYQLTGRQGSQVWNQITQNPPDGTEATLMPANFDEGWFLAFEFDEVGYVKDDEKGNLDADAILKSMKEGTEQSNAYRKSQGWSAIHVDRWIYPPGYDPATNNLFWATLLTSDDGGSSANYSTRLLGRRGVMQVTLVCDQAQMAAIVPKVKELLTAFEFNEGEKYSEWRNGDKIAQYGLTGLITGGAAVVAAKTGLLAKLAQVFAKGGKAIVLLIAAIGGGIWRLLTGRRSNAAE